MADNICNASIRYNDDALPCDLPADHTAPTDDLPQGSPHRNAEFMDVLTDEPWAWWG